MIFRPGLPTFAVPFFGFTFCSPVQFSVCPAQPARSSGGSGAQRLLVDFEQPLACFPSSLFSHSRVQYVFYSVNQQPTLISSHRAARCSARRGGSVYLTGTDKFQAVSNLELQASGSFQFRARDSRIANHHRRIGDFRMVMGACVASQISAKLVAQIAMTSI